MKKLLMENVTVTQLVNNDRYPDA